LRTLRAVQVQGRGGLYRPFDTRIDQVSEDDVKAWLIGWPRSLKTKANYHGLLFGVSRTRWRAARSASTR
jgi:hypothetical protein